MYTYPPCQTDSNTIQAEKPIFAFTAVKIVVGFQQNITSRLIEREIDTHLFIIFHAIYLPIDNQLIDKRYEFVLNILLQQTINFIIITVIDKRVHVYYVDTGRIINIYSESVANAVLPISSFSMTLRSISKKSAEHNCNFFFSSDLGPLCFVIRLKDHPPVLMSINFPLHKKLGN